MVATMTEGVLEILVDDVPNWFKKSVIDKLR